MEFLALMIVLFVVGVVGFIVFVILSPFIWVGLKISDSNDKQKLAALVGTKNVLIIKDGALKITLRDKNREVVSLSLMCNINNEEFLMTNFTQEYQYACWVEKFVNQLKDNEKSVWNPLFKLAWKAIRSLEDRDQFTENNANFVSMQNFEWIERMTHKALIGLHYKSANSQNDQLINSIRTEIQQSEQQRGTFTDEIHKQSLQLVIDTHNQRLETQKKIKNTITLLDNDIKRLQATFKLTIEGVEAEISACKLGNTRITTQWNNMVLNINLSDLDRIYEEHKQELSA